MLQVLFEQYAQGSCKKFPAELHTNFAMNDNAAELPLLHRENKHGVDTTEKPYLLISHSCY